MDNIQCQILVDNENSFLNQMIIGTVEITTIEKVVIQHAFIEVHGTSSCQFTLDKVLVKFPKFYKKGTSFTNEENIFLSRHTLVSGDGILPVHKGTLYYSFKCRIPETLPATWTGTYGKIKYMGRVVVKGDDNEAHIHLQEIVVMPRIDLSKTEHLAFEACLDVKRRFRFAVLNLGSVKVNVWIPICGIAAGQSLPLLCTIINNSKVQFGGIEFVLTKKEIYRSKFPVETTKIVRKDICRIPRMVDILSGKSEYYCVLQVDKDALPTNQYWKNHSCHLTYEVWVSVQGAIPKFSAYGYPNIDTPGIPVIIGTKAVRQWNCDKITAEVMAAIFNAHSPIVMEPPPPDDEVEFLLQIVEEELDEKTIENLTRQIKEQESAIFHLESNELVENLSS